MILVDKKPVLELPADDKRRIWFEKEFAKIQKRTEPIIIKKVSGWHLDATGRRRLPPADSIQTRYVKNTERGKEMWGYCETYDIDDKGRMKLKPNTIGLNSRNTLDPRQNPELVFFLTCVLPIAGKGYVIENPEAEAKERVDKEVAELDVKYIIFRVLTEPDELRFVAKSWGIVGASEKNKLTTRKGYKEFVADVQAGDKNLMEAKQVVYAAVEKGILNIDPITRAVKYTGNQVTNVPADEKDRAWDYFAGWLLKDSKKELYESIKFELAPKDKPAPYSIADLQGKDKAELIEIAKVVMPDYTPPPTIGEDTLRKKIEDKL
jgi:hypothetical protein